MRRPLNECTTGPRGLVGWTRTPERRGQDHIGTADHHGTRPDLGRYRRRDAAVLLTTHYMEEAETLCDRIGIIQDGRLISIDTIANLRASIGREYKLTYETSEGRQTVYGDDQSALAAQVRAQGVDEYALIRTSLDDVYLALTQDAHEGTESDAAK